MKDGDLERAQLGLAHSYSRAKVKFNIHRADNNIIQSISLLDQLDKAIGLDRLRALHVNDSKAPLGSNRDRHENVGDGILGVFGAPEQDPDHAWHAALAALEMQVAIRQLGHRWEREVGTSFALGVAVHTGEVFAGAVGSPRQSKYAVVGDPVNTVARLEEVNRNLGTEIVMSEDALALVRERVDVNPRGSFPMRGRSRSVEVFELLGLQEALWQMA